MRTRTRPEVNHLFSHRRLVEELPGHRILGFAFLENSDDPRNTPAHPLHGLLKDKCRQVVIHDPHIKKHEDLPLQTTCRKH